MPRYIDAENALKKLCSKCYYETVCKNHGGDRSCRQPEYFIIANEPTADVAPVVHGHWIYLGEKSIWKNKCSLCSFETIQPHYRFCPNCGARMDEEAEE